MTSEAVLTRDAYGILAALVRGDHDGAFTLAEAYLQDHQASRELAQMFMWMATDLLKGVAEANEITVDEFLQPIMAELASQD